MNMQYTVLDRFLRYVKIDTQSDASSKTIPSTEKQKDLGRLLVKELHEIGISDAHLDEWGYVYATIPANTEKTNVPTICFCSHMDTSPDSSGTNVKPIIHKNYDGNPEVKHGKVRILFTPDEEIGRGVDKADMKKLGADFGYTVDGEQLGSMEDETFSADAATINITGVSAHPGFALGKLENAIKIASDIIAGLPKDYLSPETTSGRQGFLHPVTMSAKAEGAQIVFIVRDFQTEKLKEKEDFLQSIIDEVLKNYPNSKAELLITEQYRNMKEVLKEQPLIVEYALDAIKMAGLTPRKGSIRGGTDGSRLSFMGLPCPNIFAGEHAFHSKHEWVSVQDMERAVDVIINICKIWEEREQRKPL